MPVSYEELLSQVADLEVKVLDGSATEEDVRSYLLLREELRQTPQCQEEFQSSHRKVEALLGRTITIPALPKPLTPEMIDRLVSEYSERLAELE